MKTANVATPTALLVALVSLIIASSEVLAQEPGNSSSSSQEASDSATIRLEQAWDMVSDGKHAEAERSADKLLSEAIAAGNLNNEFKALNLKVALQYMQNKYTPAVLQKEQRLEAIALQLGDQEMIATISNNLAYDLLVAGNTPIAEILPRLKRANSYYAAQEKSEGRWYTLMNLNWAYRLAGDLQASRDFGIKAVKTAESIEDRHAIIETCINLAETWLLENDLDQAAIYYAQAKGYAEQKQDRDKWVFDVYYARYLLKTDNPDAALARLKQAVASLLDVEIFYAAFGQAVLAEALFSSGDISGAEQQADAVLQEADNFVPREAVVYATLIKAKILSARNDAAGAGKLISAMRAKLKVFGSPSLNHHLQI